MKKKEKKHDNSERWLLTYSDLITLLMILFVVLYALSNVNQTKYEELSTSLNQAMGSSSGDSVIPKGDGVLDGGLTEILNSSGTGDSKEQKDASQKTDPGEEVEISRDEFVELRDWIYKTIKDSNLADNVTISVEEAGIVIALANDVLFDSGEAEIKDSVKDKFAFIANLLSQVSNKIEIGGHTDNVPISNQFYASNWQLSAQRAANVTEYLVDTYHIDPRRLTAVGYGEYSPIETNNTEEGRGKNRRISITILFSEINN